MSLPDDGANEIGVEESWEDIFSDGMDDAIIDEAVDLADDSWMEMVDCTGTEDTSDDFMRVTNDVENLAEDKTEAKVDISDDVCEDP